MREKECVRERERVCENVTVCLRQRLYVLV